MKFPIISKNIPLPHIFPFPSPLQPWIYFQTLDISLVQIRFSEYLDVASCYFQFPLLQILSFGLK